MENAFVVGSKEKFAIEYVHGSHPGLGFVRLWLNNLYLGAKEDETYFAYVQGDLHHLLRNIERLGNFPFPENEAKTILDLVISAKNEPNNSTMDKYVTGFGDAFDDFFIVCFFSKNKIHFVWKLNENPVFEYPNYPHEAQMQILDVKYFEKVVQEFNKQLIH